MYDAPTEVVEKTVEGKKSSEGEEKNDKNHLDVDYFFNPHHFLTHFHDSDYPLLQLILPLKHEINLEIPQPPPERLV
jgi:hypothetical protein